MINGNALYDYLLDKGYQPELVEDDTEITIECPLCSDDRPRLYVSTETGAWLCFHCHEEGNLHQFLMQVCELDGPSAFEVSRKIRLGELDAFEYEVRKREEKKSPPKILTMPPTFEAVNRRSPKHVLDYLWQRGVSPELAAARGLGYCLNGKYHHRIIIPVKNDGHLFTYIGRTILTQCPNCTERIDDCTCRPHKFPKVLTPSKMEGAAPSLTLYNLDAVRNTRPPRIVIVEGAFDALRLPNEAVALMKSSASATQLTLLAGLARGSELVLALDGDEAGYKGTIKIAESLATELVKVRVALLPEGRDPGSLSKESMNQCLNDARIYVP